MIQKVPRRKQQISARTAALLVFLSFAVTGRSQSAAHILQQIRNKLEKVNDYEAWGKMTTNVAFIKAPAADVKVYYKKPNRLRITNPAGISFIPKGSVNISLSNVFANLDTYEIIDAGHDSAGLRIIKLLPRSDTADIVLSSLYVNERSMLIEKSKMTSRENGTYELTMSYGRYSEYGLPDKIVFSFSTKDYKLPKGITLEYDDGSEKSNESLKNKKGIVEITYSGYRINVGVDDKVFQR